MTYSTLFAHVKSVRLWLVAAALLACSSMSMAAEPKNPDDINVDDERYRLHAVDLKTRKVQVAELFYSVKLSARVILPDGGKMRFEDLLPPAAVNLDLDEHGQVKDIQVLAFF